MPQVTNKCWTLWPCIGPGADKKGYHGIWEANLQPLGTNVPVFIKYHEVNVLAFINNMGAKQQAKNAQSWTQLFPALTPSVKWA
jgi:hypothetical protein